MVTRRRAYYIGLLALCVATRLATTIYYIEDTDSLRFALSVVDGFDVANLQPHFPGYPVFWAAAKALYQISGSFAIGFSLIGGVATFAVACFLPRLAGRDPLSAEGFAMAFMAVFNPMIWLMGNRYMPDLMGLAVALGALCLFAGSRFAAGGVVTGLLAGTRLSNLPLLLPAYAIALRREPLRVLGASAGGVIVWLIPMIFDTGWRGLIEAAGRQTEGHFTEFGGTVETNPDLLERLLRLIESVWAGGFGAWWPGRHWITIAVAATLVATAAALLLRSDAREAAASNRRSASIQDPSPVPRPPSPAHHWQHRPKSPARRSQHLLAAFATYFLWIFLFQNVIDKSRHVLPLVALLIIPVGIGLARLIATTPASSGARSAPMRTLLRAATVAGAAAYAAVTIVLVGQHREPTAIAQALRFVEEARPDAVASIPLVNYYLSAQGVEADYLSVHEAADRDRLYDFDGRLVVIGRYPNAAPPNPARGDTFYHNPYVNPMWSRVEVYVYDSEQPAHPAGRE